MKVADVALFLSDIQLLEFSPVRAAQGNVLVGTLHTLLCAPGLRSPWSPCPPLKHKVQMGCGEEIETGLTTKFSKLWLQLCSVS